MRILVVHTHPLDDSYSAAVRATAVAALRDVGHHVDELRLHDEGFRAAMTADERRAYHSGRPILDEHVERHAALVRTAEGIVFVYPTWWAGMPAQLKGWLDRVLVDGVAFHLRHDGDRIEMQPGLGHVRYLAGISTYGSPRAFAWLLGDAGRRTVLRSVRAMCGRGTRTDWLGLYDIDNSTPADREAFLQRVDRRMRSV